MGDREQVHSGGFPVPTPDPDWLLTVDGFDALREREVESWLTVANGESGTRGSVEGGSPFSAPAVYVAGVFGEAASELPIRRPVPAPDWLYLRLLVADRCLAFDGQGVVRHRRILDMWHGVLFREWRQRDAEGRLVSVRTARFASLDDRSIVALRAEARLEEEGGKLAWHACLHLPDDAAEIAQTAVGSLDGCGSLVTTRARNGGSHVMAALTVPSPDSPLEPAGNPDELHAACVDAGQPASIDRLAAIVPAPHGGPSAAAARSALLRACEAGYDALLGRHQAAWERCWDSCAVEIEGDDEAQRAIRFALYHLLSSAHPGRDTISVGARGLSGDAYHGHVFWDTEVFVVPFFIYTQPATARALLGYRYRNLPGARGKARELGYQGALFPWESADTGQEVTPPYGCGPDGEQIPILSGVMEHHISADIAWAVWEYWMASADDGFMRDMGIELLAETARFWASRARRDREGRFHIREVIGPDEYHECVDDNAYTNAMARWNIRRAVDALGWLRQTDVASARALCRRLAADDDELAAWQTVAERLVDGFDEASGLYEQFAGFFELHDIDRSLLRPRPLAADLLLGRDVAQHGKVVKQADVVMLCHLLAEEVDDHLACVNYAYYEPLTVHGSSLSPGIHAALAARLGIDDEAMEAFRLACSVDLGDGMGNAAAGVHLATMGSIWQAVVMGFGGVRRTGNALVVEPHLPSAWTRLGFSLRFRGARVSCAIEPAAVGITVHEGSLAVVVGGHARQVGPGRYLWSRANGDGWGTRRERPGSA